jgi:hypothetical protein
MILFVRSTPLPHSRQINIHSLLIVNNYFFSFLSIAERKEQRKSSQNECLPALLQCKNFE